MTALIIVSCLLLCILKKESNEKNSPYICHESEMYLLRAKVLFEPGCKYSGNVNMGVSRNLLALRASPRWSVEKTQKANYFLFNVHEFRFFSPNPSTKAGVYLFSN